MPKKKKQDKAKPAKGKAAKLPKEIAGIKIGKELRNAVEPVLRFAGHPMVSDALAAALIAGADSLIGTSKSGEGSAAARGGAASDAKKRSPIGLMVAVAAGEIAAHIVSAYQGGPAADRRASDGDRRAGKDRRSSGRKAPTGNRRSPARDRRSEQPDRRK